MVQNDIRGVVHSDCQVLNRASAKLIHAEDVVVDVCDAVDVVFEDIDAEGMMQLCIKTEGKLETCRQCECEPICGSYVCRSTVFDAIYGHDWIASVQPHAADQGEFSIGPVQPLIEVVHR